MTFLAGLVALIIVFAIIAEFNQCKEHNPKTGLRCKMSTGHKWRSRGIEGMWHTDARGGRWRA